MKLKGYRTYIGAILGTCWILLAVWNPELATAEWYQTVGAAIAGATGVAMRMAVK